MAKVKHIQCNTLPAELEPNAIYFVRNENIIIQTNYLGLPKFFGLKNSYPNANTPLADGDKFIVRQGSEYKEIDKKDVSNEIITFHWSGRWKLSKLKDDFSIFSTAYSANYPINSIISGYNDTSLLIYPYNKGWLMPAKGKLKNFIISARRADLDSDMRVKVIRQWYTLNNNDALVVNGQVLHESIMPIDKYKANHYEVNVKGEIVCNRGDNIAIVTNVVEDSSHDRYLYTAQFMLNFKKL